MRTAVFALTLAAAAIVPVGCSTTYQDAMDSYATPPARALDNRLEYAAARRESGADDLHAIARRIRVSPPQDAHVIGMDAALITAHRYDASADLTMILDAAERLPGAAAPDNAALLNLREAYALADERLAESENALQRLVDATENQDSAQSVQALAADAADPVARAAKALEAAAAAGRQVAIVTSDGDLDDDTDTTG